jgi:hypothetical protein
VYYPLSEIYQKLRAVQLSILFFKKSSSRALKLVKRAAGLYPCKLCEIGWQGPRSWLAKATKLAGEGHEIGWQRPQSWLAEAMKLAGEGHEAGWQRP